MRTAISFFYVDVGGPPPPLLFATDAMGVNEQDSGGFGVVAITIRSSVGRALWRTALPTLTEETRDCYARSVRWTGRFLAPLWTRVFSRQDAGELLVAAVGPWTTT